MSRIAILLFVAFLLVAGISAKSTAHFKKNVLADLFKERRFNAKRDPAGSTCVNIDVDSFCDGMAERGACNIIPQMATNCAKACNSC
uniref:U-actitoxin-Avd10a n=1 Tax=Anemonia viridis TaxID=51769 RepID=K1BAA_ANEVI|nr:RecName: Full=U-actitoxin-Avd10a; Short=U-AITX-Avd10a; AltName: Full=Potassium channel toxin avtx-10; Flags: Precursor [Anemonia viridis]